MKIHYLIPVILALTLPACDEEYGTNPIEVTYDLIPFAHLQLETSSDIRIIQSNSFQVVVEGEERDVYDTDVDVLDDWLIIREHGQIAPSQRIYIYVPVLLDIESNGSSEVYGESQFQQNENMTIRNSGSGRIDMYVDTDNLDLYVSGSGDIYLEGLADNTDLTLSGSGWVRAFNLGSDFSDVRVSGSGSAEVKVDTDLDVLISGSGDVFYKGHPQVSSQITGSGPVLNAN